MSGPLKAVQFPKKCHFEQREKSFLSFIQVSEHRTRRKISPLRSK